VEMKKHDINSIIQDVKRIKAVLKNTKSLDAVNDFLINNSDKTNSSPMSEAITISPGKYKPDQALSSFISMEKGMNEKTIIRTDLGERSNKHMLTYSDKVKDGDKACNSMQSIHCGMNEKTIIREIRDHYTSIHPTQKPTALIERLLALVTKENDIVIDPFSGSCSTGIACMNLNRYFIGYEIDEEYYLKSVERLKKHKHQYELFK